MGKGRSPQETIEPKVFASVQEIDQGLSKLNRLLAEVHGLDPNSVRHNDPRKDIAERNIHGKILEIYGSSSPEYKDFQYHRISYGPISMGMEEHEIQKVFADGVSYTLQALENLIRDLEQRKTDLGGDPDAKVRVAFSDLDLHPRIASVTADLFANGHYRNAVLDACVALVNLVKEKSRRHDLDGAPLMREVFSRQNPVLSFNDRKDKTDEDEQEGFMHIFEGVALALRNPRAHTLQDDSPETALEYIALTSLLAKKVEQSKRIAK